MIPSSSLASDHEADLFEVRFHQQMSKRNFSLGIALIVLTSIIFVVTEHVLFGALVLPGVLLIVKGWTHREKGQKLERDLHARPPSTNPRVLVMWSGAWIPGLAVQQRGEHVYVRFANRTEVWVPSLFVRQAA